MRREVFGEEANDGASPHTEDDASVDILGSRDAVHASDDHLIRQEANRHGVQAAGHADRSAKKLDLKHVLDVLLLPHGHDVGGDEVDDQAHTDANAGDVERIHEGRPPGVSDLGDRRAEEHSSARSLSKRTEKVRPHSSHVTDIVTNVVSDDSRIIRRVCHQEIHFSASLTLLFRKSVPVGETNTMMW